MTRRRTREGRRRAIGYALRTVRFVATIDIDLPDDVVERSPTLWERCKGLVGGEADLETETVRTRVEAATFLYEVRAALGTLGIDNARWLVADGALVFEDPKGRPSDLPELMTAFADHVLLQTDPIRQLRIGVEHEEAGLAFEIEARMAVEHPRDEPADRISVTARMLDLTPGHHESPKAYRARLASIVSDASRWATVKLQFSAFVSRLEQALGEALPGASLRASTRPLGLDLQGEAALRPERDRKTHGAATSRSFDPSLEKRIAKVIAMPSPYAARLRDIEALQTKLVNELALSERESIDAVPRAVEEGLAELNQLIDEHNHHAPIERSIDMDPGAGDGSASLASAGPSWSPLSHVSVGDLRRQTAARRAARV